MHDSASPMSLNMSLIRTLARHTGEQFILRRQARSAAVANSGTGNSRCYDTESKLLLTAVNGNDLSDPYFMSLDVVLAAAAQCVAGGAEFNDIALSFSAEIPGISGERDIIDPQLGGDALSLILGAYRAQIEYCLPDAGSVYTYSGKRYGFTVSAAARLNGNPVPMHFILPGNGVYLLAPAYSPDGLPNFEDLRRMWRYVSSLCRDGRVASAFAVGSGGAAETIRTMSGGDIDFLPAGNISDDVLYSPAPGGIIVESGSQIEGVLIGHTARPGRFMSI
jgi:phosphoribosylformylglycinamidine synthase